MCMAQFQILRKLSQEPVDTAMPSSVTPRQLTRLSWPARTPAGGTRTNKRRLVMSNVLLSRLWVKILFKNSTEHRNPVFTTAWTCNTGRAFQPQMYIFLYKITAWDVWIHWSSSHFALHWLIDLQDIITHMLSLHRQINLSSPYWNEALCPVQILHCVCVLFCRIQYGTFPC